MAVTAALATANPYTLMSIPFQSPRLMGEATVKAGQATRYGKKGLAAIKDALETGNIDPKLLANWVTQEQADAELDILALDALTKAMKASPVLVLASSNKQVAIADFIYNLGIGNYSKSTLKKYVDQKNWLAAAGEIKKWDKAGGVTLKGLTIRRKKEANLLLK